MDLEAELAYYESLKPDLLSHHAGKFALIIDHELVGVYDQQEEAYKAGLARAGNVPMLIKQVLSNEPSQSLPAMNLGLLGARP